MFIGRLLDRSFQVKYKIHEFQMSKIFNHKRQHILILKNYD